MKYKFLVLLVLLSVSRFNSISAQTTNKIYNLSDVEIKPGVPSEQMWQNFLKDSLRTDFLKEKNAPKGKYTVTVSFVVNANGSISDVKALNDPGYGTAQEAVRVMEQSANGRKGPGFRAAMLHGTPVNCRTTKTITFEVK